MLDRSVDYTKGLARVTAEIEADVADLNDWLATLDRAHKTQEWRRRLERELTKPVEREP